MCRKAAFLLIFLGAALSNLGGTGNAATNIPINDLPSEAIQIARNVVAECKDMGNGDETDGKLDQTIDVYEVGNGKRLAVFTPSRICSTRGNSICSTDGCDIYIYFEQSARVWSQVLNQTVLDEKIDGGHSKPLQVIFDLRGGSARCKRDRSSFCTFELTWKGAAFGWKQLR